MKSTRNGISSSSQTATLIGYTFIFRVVSYQIPMISPFSHAFSHTIPMISPFSHAFSYDFPIFPYVFPWFSHGKTVDQLRHKMARISGGEHTRTRVADFLSREPRKLSKLAASCAAARTETSLCGSENHRKDHQSMGIHSGNMTLSFPYFCWE